MAVLAFERAQFSPFFGMFQCRVTLWGRLSESEVRARSPGPRWAFRVGVIAAHCVRSRVTESHRSTIEPGRSTGSTTPCSLVEPSPEGRFDAVDLLAGTGRVDFGGGRGPHLPPHRTRRPEVCQVRLKSSSGEVTKPRKDESPKVEMPERSAKKNALLLSATRWPEHTGRHTGSAQQILAFSRKTAPTNPKRSEGSRAFALAGPSGWCDRRAAGTDGA